LPHQCVYIDQAGIDNREDYPYGYGEIGQRFHALKSGRTYRVSSIAALKQAALFAPMTFAGSGNRDLFETRTATATGRCNHHRQCQFPSVSND